MGNPQHSGYTGRGTWRPLVAHCRARGITCFSTPMSRGAAPRLAPLALPLWKMGSGDVQDLVLLDYLVGTGKPIILSSGMVSAIRTGGHHQVDPSRWYGQRMRELEGVGNESHAYFKQTLVAARHLAAGSALTSDAVQAMRPRKYLDGLPATRSHDVLGKVLACDVAALEPLTAAAFR